MSSVSKDLKHDGERIYGSMKAITCMIPETEQHSYQNKPVPPLALTSKESTVSVDEVFMLNNATDSTNCSLIEALFNRSQSQLYEELYPKTVPTRPPERRGKRHRAASLRYLNNFRHWWKTSRLLVRLAGATVLAFGMCDWSDTLLKLEAHKHKGLRSAVKTMKMIGRGGTVRPFLQIVQPLTRTLRLYMAIMRGCEATVDDRFYEVVIAEAIAFMGNRSLRWWARHFVDWSCKYYIFPFAMFAMKDNYAYIELSWKSVIFLMGLLRGILPFLSSFVGSRIGRSTALAASDRLNFRWKTVENAQDFVVNAGTYRPTNESKEVLQYAKKVAQTLGLGCDPAAVRSNLSDLGFEIIGTGKGGYALYRAFAAKDRTAVFHLHLTPYGPSILDEMPRYIILERKKIDSITSYPSAEQGCTLARINTDAMIKGFSYSGAFFTFQEWAALKERHDYELHNFGAACKYMGNKSNSQFAISHISPPTNLTSLKAFVRTGRLPRKQKKDNARWSQVMQQLDRLKSKLIKMEKKGTAPKGVIIYMEGLDCAGKSSTGGLIMQALEKAGYDVSQIQYNKPPTAEQRAMPWMWRFKQPTTMAEGKYRKSALVWDRGPAGDFVYGNLNDLPMELKHQRYIEFHEFEKECIAKGILFCKLFFVTSRDAIAKTLGKRLAHKKIVQDLHTWLDANSSYHEREGLEEIEKHIDPTDFIALNKYEYNKKVFHDFVLHTDYVGQIHADRHFSSRPWARMSCSYLPWLIVNTTQRHRARIQIMHSFEQQLDRFAQSIKSHELGGTSVLDAVPASLGANGHEENGDELKRLLADSEWIYFDECVVNEGSLWVAVKESFIYVLFMIVIAGSYLHQTWKVRFWGGGDEDA